MKVSNNFILQEFICPEVYNIFGSGSIKFIDNRIIDIAQSLRDGLGVGVTINNWHRGDSYKESGLRSIKTSTGAAFSQHKFGRAIDCKFSNGVTIKDAYGFIVDNWDIFSKLGLTTIENIEHTPTWLHLDCRNVGDRDELLIVNP